MHLSFTALKKLIPFLEQGAVYSEACSLAGYDHSKPGGSRLTTKLPPIPADEVRNPVVLRSLAQARKVVNAVVERYGAPVSVHIEVARELGKNVEDRRKLEKRMSENAASNERRREHFAELFGRPSRGDEALKLRLYREQDGKCPYSQAALDLSRLIEPGYVEVDHAIPYSRSFDDSMTNKVLAVSSENQNKGNRTPYEYFGHDNDRWSRFSALVLGTTGIDARKKSKLLSQTAPTLERTEWMPRNLIDTQYIARYFSSFIRDNLLFADSSVKLPVICVSGHITSLLRGMWGIAKVRQKDDLHHAADAVVVACISQRIIGLITRFRQQRECNGWRPGETFVDEETGKLIDFKFSFPLPWAGFRKEMEARLSDDPSAELAELGLPAYVEFDARPVIVSRKSDRSVDGPLHKDTIMSSREDRFGRPISITRKRLEDLKAGDLPHLLAPETNVKLYAEIKKRLAEFNGDARKAFAMPLFKPTNDGRTGPRVQSVRLSTNQPSGFSVRGGIADNSEMVRIDIFVKNRKFYIVPLYTWHFAARILPDLAIVPNKPEPLWTRIDDSFEFVLTLYPFDLVSVVDSKGTVCFGYYRGCHRSTGAIKVSPPNDVKEESAKEGIGMRTAKAIQKFEVGVLGDYNSVKSEVRRGVADGRGIKSRETAG